MRFNKSLDNILGQKSKVKALRYLVNYKQEMSIRELSREIGLVPANLSVILKELEAERVLRSKKFGKTIVFSLNQDNYLTSEIIVPLFKKERLIREELGKIIVKNIKFPYESIILFGSVARGDSKTYSDVDLAIIIRDSGRSDDIEDQILNINPTVSRLFGNSISPVVMKKAEFSKKFNRGDKLIRNIAKEGIVIAGKLISELI